jgi:hypothetical protein
LSQFSWIAFASVQAFPEIGARGDNTCKQPVAFNLLLCRGHLTPGITDLTKIGYAQTKQAVEVKWLDSEESKKYNNQALP